MINIVYNQDCLPAMKLMKDNQFDLAIVDPPYNQQWGNLADITSGRKDKMRGFYQEARGWDKIPKEEYFNELKRISNNQIIFGYNYFTQFLGSTNNLIVWDKMITGNINFLRFELIYCSFNVSDIIRLSNSKMDKQHPTQKPIKLYKWLLKNYTKPNDTILDTHVGSGSSRIACWEMGYDFTGFEIDKDYWEAQEKRFMVVKNQMRIFE